MPLYSNSGWIEVVVGCMESGKSEELQRRTRRALIANKAVEAFACARTGLPAAQFSVATRRGRRIDARPLESASALAGLLDPATEVIALDDIQFLEEEDVDALSSLASEGVQVICAGLDMDFRGRAFPAVGRLMAEAEAVDKIYAVCAQCHGRATRTQRLIDGAPSAVLEPTVLQSPLVQYEPRCRACHLVPEAP